MNNELTYQTAEGYTVFTSQYLKKKGTCCKSACLHCPFGFTVKKLGIQFKKVQEVDFLQIEDIMKESGQPIIDLKSFLPDHVQFVILKDQICGVFLHNHIVIKHLYLKPFFQQQNLSKELIEAYFY